MREGRIPYLDGLRAYSILLVLLFHSNERQHWLGSLWMLRPIIADGYLGVRIFFVLSGFLITFLLLDEIDKNGKISLRGFYERRIARIFPAYYLYLAIITVLTVVGFLAIHPIALFEAATYTWNFSFVWNHFFPPGEQIKDSVLLDHFWTLSLEEQFYIAWPGCLVLFGRRWSAALAMIGVVAFPLLRFCAFRYWGSEYPGTQGNILWRMMQDMVLIGTLAAFVARSRWLGRLNTTSARPAFPLISLLVLFVLCPWIGSLGLGMDTYLVPTLQAVATVLIMFWLLTGSGGPIRSVLEWAPVRRLGLISYSLYIFQQAITFWDRAAWIRFPWNALLTIPLALACYKFWEMPMRTQLRKWFHQLGKSHGEVVDTP